jgi:hypothetical protein
MWIIGQSHRAGSRSKAAFGRIVVEKEITQKSQWVPLRHLDRVGIPGRRVSHRLVFVHQVAAKHIRPEEIV